VCIAQGALATCVKLTSFAEQTLSCWTETTRADASIIWKAVSVQAWKTSCRAWTCGTSLRARLTHLVCWIPKCTTWACVTSSRSRIHRSVLTNALAWRLNKWLCASLAGFVRCTRQAAFATWRAHLILQVVTTWTSRRGLQIRLFNTQNWLFFKIGPVWKFIMRKFDRFFWISLYKNVSRFPKLLSHLEICLI